MIIIFIFFPGEGRGEKRPSFLKTQEIVGVIVVSFNLLTGPSVKLNECLFRRKHEMNHQQHTDDNATCQKIKQNVWDDVQNPIA